MESSLGKEKGLEILSLFVNMKKTDLPEQAHSIIKECKGMLFCHKDINSFFVNEANEYDNLTHQHPKTFLGYLVF